MSDLFINIVNMSISAGWIVLAVMLLRLIFKKAPKWIAVLLWSIVAVRLICPFTVESVVSLIPSAETISPNIMMDKTPEINSGIPVINNTLNSVISGSLSPDPAESVNPLQIWIPILTVVWLAGVVLLLAYTAISYWRVKRKIGTAVLLRNNIFQSETVVSPFVFGIIKPKIYLPFQISTQDTEHVIAHERAHIRRKDHWWKPFGFLLLTLHWFNPLMWLGYFLLCRDIELACDEKVIKELSHDQKADYSQALLTCSVNRRMISACPLAFGEVGVKSRVKSVLNYRKPAFWIIVAAIITSVAVALCFLTNPASDRLKNIENRDFHSRIEKTAAVFVSDGEIYRSIGAISEDLLQDISKIKISRKEISLGREENRDKSHTIILQTNQEAELTIYSYIKGLYIHFNSDFTAVWVNDGIKATLSYKVINPEKAQEIYNHIANYNVSEPVVTDATGFHTDYDGVYLTVESIDINVGGYKVFNIFWHNDTSLEIVYGEGYSIEFKDGDEWKYVGQDDIFFKTIANLLEPRSTRAESYTTQRFDISNYGTYRLRSKFWIGDGNQYYTWIEFEMGEAVTKQNGDGNA